MDDMTIRYMLWVTVFFEAASHSQVLSKNEIRDSRLRMSHLVQLLSSVYPSFRHLIYQSVLLPLSARSLIIKCCQAQQWPSPSSTSVLSTLLKQHPEVNLRDQGGIIRCIPLMDYGTIFDLQFNALSSAILLDIMRALPVDISEIHKARWDSWVKEIALSEGNYRSSVVNWKVYFDDTIDPSTPVSSRLPINPNAIRPIRRQLRHFRERYINKTLYARATHKNMSWSTRRRYEEDTGFDLDDVPIFGQDDWQRHYNKTGVQIGGTCEMRQKWYPSGAKPRTYFAQGGESYSKARFLQDFFTEFADSFTPTNHTDRLNPSRLVGSTIDRDDPHFFIYDLSNFTSNMCEQREFCYALAEFFQGIPVRILDERNGFMNVDLGELLFEYCITCVEGPSVSYEKWDSSLPADHFVRHGTASLLGIFGNLMTCTVAHFFIMSPIAQNWQEINVAGDDGLVAEDRLNNAETHYAISIVGAYSREKCFPGDDESPICLKRPCIETFPTINLLNNVVPPTIITCISYLRGYNVDPRYVFMGIEDLPWRKRVKVVGRDLLRFLTSAFFAKVPKEDVTPVFKGFARLVKSLCPQFDVMRPSVFPPWPMDPEHYEFEESNPILQLCLFADLRSKPLPMVGRLPDPGFSLQFTGQSVMANRSSRLKLLVRLGYLEEFEETYVEVDQYSLFLYWYNRLSRVVQVDPEVYTFTVLRDIPSSFIV